MSELPAGREAAPEVVPRDSASAIVLRPGPRGREVLLGVRSRRSRFMPGHWAFPGGAMDEQDRRGEPGTCRRQRLEAKAVQHLRRPRVPGIGDQKSAWLIVQ